MGLFGDSPEFPDYDDAARRGIYADINTQEIRRKIEAAAMKGEKITIDGVEYDFSQTGDAATAIELSRQLAQLDLDLSRQYSDQFVDQRLRELDLADPDGRQMRRDLYDSIVSELEGRRERPLADSLEATIMAELEGSGRLPHQVEREIGQAVRGQQVARGNFLGRGAVQQEADAIAGATEQYRNMRQQRALEYLQSGATPEDVAYRENQQDMSNLGAFLAGERPVAQFSQLSGAQGGATPFISGGITTRLNPNAAQMGTGFAQNVYSQQYDWSQSQVNPFFAGLGTTFQLAGAAGQLGWQPFSNGGNNAANIAANTAINPPIQWNPTNAAINPSNPWTP